jgi:hypothetical protein
MMPIFSIGGCRVALGTNKKKHSPFEKSLTSVGFFKGEGTRERERKKSKGKIKLNFASIFPFIYIVCVFMKLKKK